VAMGEDDVGGDVSQSGADKGTHKSSSSENCGSDSGNVVSSSLIIDKKSGSFREGSHQGRVKKVGRLGLEKGC